jgi:hypothetical protein
MDAGKVYLHAGTGVQPPAKNALEPVIIALPYRVPVRMLSRYRFDPISVLIP